MIKCVGFKIHRAEVEHMPACLPGELERAVIGRPDPVLGQRVHAFIVTHPDSALDAAAARAHYAALLTDHKVPETVTIDCDPWPRNANGRIQKAVPRERLLAASAR